MENEREINLQYFFSLLWRKSILTQWWVLMRKNEFLPVYRLCQMFSADYEQTCPISFICLSFTPTLTQFSFNSSFSLWVQSAAYI